MGREPRPRGADNLWNREPLAVRSHVEPPVLGMRTQPFTCRPRHEYTRGVLPGRPATGYHAGAMLLATWNINSIRARIELLSDWLERRRPDVVCLQETKVVDELFPVGTLGQLGYHAAFVGEKSYNGVAILSREPLADIRVGFPLPTNHDQRLISGIIGGIRVYSAYFPNGRDPLSPHYEEKLAWIDGLGDLIVEERAPNGNSIALLGDFNVAPEPRDVYSPEEMEGHIHFTLGERAALKGLLDRGLVDAFRLRRTESGLYSWWDYRAAAFRRNLGLRIDHVWATPELAPRVTDAFIDIDERRKEHCSDHTPVVVELAD
ncbi:MAG: exodeoxyribonuclease III [Chloroflexi bacterium]|nr:exodeoxyribonuclease III [Chloroflexota bacterium]